MHLRPPEQQSQAGQGQNSPARVVRESSGAGEEELQVQESSNKTYTSCGSSSTLSSTSQTGSSSTLPSFI